MKVVPVKSLFENDIADILNNPKYKHIGVVDRGFVSVENIPTEAILFLGINPSYTKPIRGLTFYELYQRKNSYKQYFGKFEDLSEKVGLIWGHMDLLYFQETQQSAIDDIMQQQDGVQFIWEQLQASKKILESANPKILIVSNTKARQFLGKDKSKGKNEWLNYDFLFDNAIGTYRLKTQSSNLYNIPVFFTSMFTGQRALDTGSYERLVWHIKFVLNIEKNNPNSQTLKQVAPSE